MDPAQLARLGSLPIQARVIVEGALSGLHRAAVHGSSVEFAEHKEYSPGDELRHVDWKAYAKLDRYYVKQFEQESQLTVYLVLDASASMAFSGGGIAKLEYGGLLLAALAYLVIQQQDKVGLIACGDRSLETLVPPRGRTTHFHDLMSVLESILARGGRGLVAGGRARPDRRAHPPPPRPGHPGLRPVRSRRRDPARARPAPRPAPR